MGKLIGSGASDNLGERIFIEKAKEYFADDCIIYWNRQVYGREFDVCVLVPGKGILVFELKGWREDTVLRVEDNDIVISTPDGERKASPMRQAFGYRHLIGRFIRENIDKNTLVVHMVCLPQISKAFHQQMRLDIVCEERFTILKEDLENNASFFSKIDQALREANHWNRDSFDRRTMLEVRNLFEADIDLTDVEAADMDIPVRVGIHDHDYSRFYYLPEDVKLTDEYLGEMISQYLRGCKLYCVVSSEEAVERIVKAVDANLLDRGLVRSGNNIKASFAAGSRHAPAFSKGKGAFSAFHLSVSCIDVSKVPDVPGLEIRNGVFTAEQELQLKRIGEVSQFNVEQYLAEHADPEKNIVIRAGAGTGKTFTMIARIAFVCYSQNVKISQMADRIVMITFTNEAADQMESKLKAYFQSLYLITSDVEYLSMISCIDHMQISTIHAYAKGLIAQLGTEFGYGVDLGITSSEFFRKKKIAEIIDGYVAKQVHNQGKGYVAKLGMPIYTIRDRVLDFIGKLHNKSVDIRELKAENFGGIASTDSHKELHELLAYVIPAVEKAYHDELLESNKIHLGSMMSILYRFLTAEKNKARLRDIQRSKTQRQFMFVDEFQDTDDTQIEALLAIAEYWNYKLFVVGDIKQCIYRFRGAEEAAFEKLGIRKEEDKWREFPLRRNYRTDSSLLEIFDRSFTAWGQRSDRLLTYEVQNDKLIGVKDYNSYPGYRKNRYYTCITIPNETMLISALVSEIKRLQRRIQWEEANRTEILSPEEKSIAILVRENWQAERIKRECAAYGLQIQTNTGGDLYMSQPALDMMILVNALVHPDEAEYLYTLAVSNFFKLEIPKSNLYEMRAKIRTGGWRKKVDEREPVNFLSGKLTSMLADDQRDNRWSKVVENLRTQPVLQVLRDLYSRLQPWKNYSGEEEEQHYYQLNVDLLFEQMINACNVDRLTINTLQETLFNSIASQISVDSRVPIGKEEQLPIQCITVHKSKGLEYGHVILPFCYSSLDYIKKAQLHVTTKVEDGTNQIGYCLAGDGSSTTLQNEYFDEKTEKADKAREEARILYVAMTRAIRSFSWIEMEGKRNLSWQNLIEKEE